MLREDGFRWFPKGAAIANYPEAALEVGVADLGESKKHVVGYYGNGWRKPAFNYAVKNDRVDAFLEERIAAGKASVEYREKRKAERKAKMAEPNPLKVGDVLRCSWGYDQTNVDYYQVLELVGKRSVIIREIGCRSIEGSEGFMSDRVSPVPGSFLENSKPMLKRVGMGGEVKIASYASAYKVEPNETTYRSWYA